jgi:hypothetical protein
MRRVVLLLLCALALSSVPAFAQRFSATLRGTVTDSSGAVIPGVTVTARNRDTGLTRSATTDEAGLYTFAELPVGVYEVDAELSGFKKAVLQNVELNVADVRVADLVLNTGALTETVTVEAAALQVQTSGGDLAGLVTGEQVRELPLNGRNFVQLALLQPGVTAMDTFNSKDKGLMTGVDMSVSGSLTTGNLWTVDGANNNDVGSNRTILIYPSVDAIEEFKIHRNSYSAEFGQASGGTVNIVTRGGTNDYRGSGYYFGRTDALASKSYFIEKNEQEKEDLKYNDFGYTFGGPIIRDKVHFFWSQEWNYETRGIVRSAFVPTDAERNGDFSASIAGCSPPTPIDPLTGSAFANNRIPADRISEAGRTYLSLYPSPNVTPASGSCNNWVTAVNTSIDWRQENGRVDWSLNDRARVMVRYTQDAWTNGDPTSAFNRLWGDDGFPAVDSRWDQPGKSFIAQLNQTIGSNATNTLQFSYSGNRIDVERDGLEPALNGRINSLIPGVFADSVKTYGAERSHPVFWGGQGYGTLWNEAPFHNLQDLFVLKDDYSRVFGAHLVKAGALVSFNKKDEDVGGASSDEAPQFWGSTGINNNGVDTGNILADFLLRDMTFGFSENESEPLVHTRWRDLEFYVADTWKVTPRLTVDLGVRYSLYFSPYDAEDRITSFVPSTFNPALGNDPCNGLVEVPDVSFCREAGFEGGTPGPNRGLTEYKKNLFAPRLGAAWDLFGTGKTAVRVGLGQFYLRDRLSRYTGLGGQPPFRLNVSGSRKLDTAAEPCPGCYSQGAGTPQSGIPLETDQPHNWQWNASVEHEIMRNTTLEVGYVGNRGVNLPRHADVNQVPPENRLAYATAGGDTAFRQSLRPFGIVGDQFIDTWRNDARSQYHALQTEMTSRFWNNSQLQMSYTLSKMDADVDVGDSSGSEGRTTSITDLTNPDLDYGPSELQRTHSFSASVVLNLPTPESESGIVKHLFGDWQITSLALASSGTPITVYVGAVPDINGVSGTGFTDNQRPNLTDVSCDASGGLDEQILNPAAFTLDGFQLGTIGNAGRGVCTGPGFFQVDLGFFKNIRLNNRFRLQVRIEVFNVFNRTNFIAANVDNIMEPSAVTFNTGDAATATTITSAAIPGNFGQATATRDPRQAQIGVKIIF